MRRSPKLAVATTQPRERPPRTRSWQRLMPPLLFVAVVLTLHLRGTPDRHTLSLDEVRALLPGAAALEPQPAPRGGVRVLDAAGTPIGVAVRTLPEAEGVIGYAGPTDTLVVFDERDRVVGLRVRSSADTRDHLADVVGDRAFMNQLDGLSWEEVAAFDVRASPIDAVSGATMTSRALMDGVAHRLQPPGARRRTVVPWRWGYRDTIALSAVAGGLLIAFGGHRVRRPFRTTFSVATVAALGFVGGDFVTQGLLVGWASGGVPVRTAPGLVLLCAVALLLPLAAGKGVYCHQICPHGLLQDFVARVSPWRWPVGPRLRAALHWLPRLLLAAIVLLALLPSSVDLALFEAFDAYTLTIGLSTAWAVASLLTALVVPRAYCRFGCPTGALLEGLRRPRHHL